MNFSIALLACALTLPAMAADISDVYRSVVRIEVATQVPDYETPWNTGRFGGERAPGF